MSKSDSYLKMHFTYLNDGETMTERMWVKSVGNNYEIDNIPFYVKNYSLGDVVSGTIEDGNLVVKDLITESGNSTIQIVFYDKEIIRTTMKTLEELQCQSEISNIPSLIAVNIPATVDYFGVIKPFLDEGFENEKWDYQEACLAH
ncbi:DUF4265 domain-containing protein [Taibaiella soli]|uniref:DUF4265 domain-containing protein n=1 Tax=Taibaiella soli TaxID=1649169 RepID=A0A2W2BGI9_9BACT|nr:DUF4265 domain-containing protein [Taibaiella soli]PZF72606.1 hypothetical protein DN068_12125 [Taibaiella soli]